MEPRTTHSRPGRRLLEGGMTLFEIMIVLAIMGMLLFLGFYAVGAVSKTSLRHDSVRLAAALRSARLLAAESGMQHRLVIDLDKQTYHIEACPDPVQLVRGGREESTVDKKAIERLKQEPPLLGGGRGGPGGMQGMIGGLDQLNAAMGPGAVAQADAQMSPGSGATSAADELKVSAALAGVKLGASRCGVAPNSPGDAALAENPAQPTVHAVDDGHGIQIRRVYVQHLRDPVTTGKVSVNFFALGRSEKALLEVVDKSGDQFTILVYGLTGRTEVRGDAVDPDKHMRRNGAGDEVKER